MSMLRLRPASGILHERRGSVAIELAIVLPLLFLMLMGFFEAYKYMRTVGLAERTAASLANLMARQQARLVDCQNTTDALNLGTYVMAAEKMMSPLPLSETGEVMLSAVHNPAVGIGQTPVPKVAWQRHSTYTLKDAHSAVGTEGKDAILPGGIVPDVGNGDTVLVAEVFFRFTPFAMTSAFWPDHPGVVTISRAAYFRSRIFAQSALAPAPQGCVGLPKT